MKRFLVAEHEAGDRLDAWLAFRLPELSRTRIQKLIKDEAVTVNGKPAKQGLVVGVGDHIEVPDTAEMPEPGKGRGGKNLGVRVVDETKDWMVIEKPSGLLVHPAEDQKKETLVDFILAQDPKIASVGDSPIRPGIMHRLDREASGLMVIAKTPEAFDSLKGQFQAHTIKKTYLALVHGKLAKDFGVIDTPIGRVKGMGRMAARTQVTGEEKEAHSEYDVLDRFPHASLVEVRTETGRMHQVRVHMKSIGHPLVGDSLYAGGHHHSPSLDKCPRLFLHAAMLGFSDPATGEWKEFRAELPEDLKIFLDVLKKKHKK